jgi:hypothetical protein
VEFLVSSSLASPCLMEANRSASFTTSIRAMNGRETWMDILPKPVQSAWKMLNFDIPIGTQRIRRCLSVNLKASSREWWESPENDSRIVVFIMVK